MTKRSAAGLVGGVFAVWAAGAGAAPTVQTGFEEANFGATGLTDYSSITAPTLTAGAGTGGSTGLDFGSDGAAVSASRTIDAAVKFSMMGKFNGNNNTSAGTLSFGWTQASADFNPYSGGGTGVVATDHVIVGLARDVGSTFHLSAVNGTHGNMSSANFFGSASVSLTSGNWYRLEGTVLYDAGTKTFTFNNVSLDDFGTAGTAEVTADLLSGTGKTVTAATFGTAGRALFMTNRDRGFQVTDNYLADVVPEPACAGVVVAAGLVALGRRRRGK